MKPLPVFVIACLALSGACARKSESEVLRAELAAAEERARVMEEQRVPRDLYEASQALLQVRSERIAGLERELNRAREELAAQEPLVLAALEAQKSALEFSVHNPGTVLTRGFFEQSNGTFVYSPDAQLLFGGKLKVMSPSGLLVSDPDRLTLAGDLKIDTGRGLSLESEDAVISAQPDGSVKFTGSSLTVKFDEKAAAPTAKE